MRMWMVDPSLLCSVHLRGEHVECHMLVGCLQRDKRLTGYVRKGLIDTTQLYPRHEQLAKELVHRGMQHKSPLPLVNVIPQGHVDTEESLQELCRRCPRCRARITKYYRSIRREV